MISIVEDNHVEGVFAGHFVDSWICTTACVLAIARLIAPRYLPAKIQVAGRVAAQS